MPVYHVAQVNIGQVRAPIEDAAYGRICRPARRDQRARRSQPRIRLAAANTGGQCNLFSTLPGRRPDSDQHVRVGERLPRCGITFTRRLTRSFSGRGKHGSRSFRALYMALWWVPAGHRPGMDEATKRIAHLEKHGPTQFAFTFKTTFEPDEQFQQGIDWSSFVPCPAA